MAYKIFTRGNYFYIVDTTNNKEYDDFAKNVRITRGTTTGDTFYIQGVPNFPDDLGIDFADIKKENGDAYADLATFIAFYEAGTGGFSSPQGGGQIVFTTDTQTLTNKTLTSPVINSPTGITADDITGLYAPNRVIYVGKHGNDSNTGTSPRNALLTFAAAITKATALTPISTNPVLIACKDAGIYAETTRINVPSWVDIMACDATIKDDGVHANAVMRVDANSSVWFKNIEQTGSGTLAIEGKDTAGDRYIKADEIKVTGGGQAINNASGGTTAANINVDVPLITVDTGIGITDNSAGGEINLNVSQIKLTGNGSTGVRSTGTGNITGKVFSITESGSPTSTIGLDINSGTARLSIENLNTDTAYDVESGAKLALFCADLSGTELNDGTVEITKASHGNSDGTDHTFVGQDVTPTATPTFVGQNLSDDLDFTVAGKRVNFFNNVETFVGESTDNLQLGAKTLAAFYINNSWKLDLSATTLKPHTGVSMDLGDATDPFEKAYVDQVITKPTAITVTANAGTVTRDYRINNFTNSSAATMTITLSTAGAQDGDLVMVRVYDFSGAAQTITWVNTEDSTVTAPVTSNGSTTLPLTIGYQYNSQTSKWRCISKA